MDNFQLEEDEHYQMQCGEMFFTNQGRLIFHCTLCNDMKFDGFDLYEIHIKEHIPIYSEDEQIDREFPQNDKISILENCLEQSSYTNEDHPFTVPFIKEENDSMDSADVLNEEEMPLSIIKKQKPVRFKSGKRIFKTVKRAKRNAIEQKPKQPPKDSYGSDVTVKQRDPTVEDLQIPDVVREVRSRVFPRSLLTPPEERKHKCPICEVAFKDRHNMIHHFKRHTSNKDHKCPECNKAFYTATEVRIHMRSHNKERPFLCSICGRSYVSNSHLSEHLKRHSNQRNHKCEICQKAFFNKAQLNGHMVGHSSDRPFSCEICAANFTRQKALKNHLKLHENKREFKCTLCDSGFNQRAGLFSHMKTAHKMD